MLADRAPSEGLRSTWAVERGIVPSRCVRCGGNEKGLFDGRGGGTIQPMTLEGRGRYCESLAQCAQVLTANLFEQIRGGVIVD